MTNMVRDLNKIMPIQPLSLDQVSDLPTQTSHKCEIDGFTFSFLFPPFFLKLQIITGQLKSGVRFLAVNQALNNAQLVSLF